MLHCRTGVVRVACMRHRARARAADDVVRIVVAIERQEDGELKFTYRPERRMNTGFLTGTIHRAGRYSRCDRQDHGTLERTKQRPPLF
jgi:hypothetical protein